MSPLINQLTHVASILSKKGVESVVPIALLPLMQQIKKAGGDEKTAKIIVCSAWDGSMAKIECGHVIPLTDAIQRSQVVFDPAMKAYFKIVSVKSPGKEGMRMRLAARVAFKVSLIFRNFTSSRLHWSYLTI